MTGDEHIEIDFPIMRYDITMPLFEGRVNIDGVSLKPTKVSSMVFSDNPALRTGNFGLCDFNLGYLLPAIDAGWEIVALPIFSKRKPVFQSIFCRAESGITTPKDLEGKKIGTRQYRTAITVWTRGLLKEKYGVDASKMHWIAQVKEVFPNYDRTAQIDYVDGSKNIVDRFLEGEVDAIITDVSDVRLFEKLEDNPKVRRLFTDYFKEDEKLYHETGIYTPVHILVMSSRLNRRHEDLARKLFVAFEEAKKLAYEDILSDRGGFSVVYLRERLKEQIANWGDPWAYGVRANQRTIDTFIRYNCDQGMIRSELSYQQIFAEGTLGT